MYHQLQKGERKRALIPLLRGGKGRNGHSKSHYEALLRILGVLVKLLQRNRINRR